MVVAEYRVVRERGAYAAEELEDRVNAMIAVGWQPVGGVAVAADGGPDRVFVQAMVRSEEEARR